MDQVNIRNLVTSSMNDLREQLPKILDEVGTPEQGGPGSHGPLRP